MHDYTNFRPNHPVTAVVAVSRKQTCCGVVHVHVVCVFFSGMNGYSLSRTPDGMLGNVDEMDSSSNSAIPADGSCFKFVWAATGVDSEYLFVYVYRSQKRQPDGGRLRDGNGDEHGGH